MTHVERLRFRSEISLLKTLKPYVTPATGALFLIVGVSGVALFFHLGQGLFESMHRWLGMMLLVPVVFHLQRNWRSLLNYVQGGRFLIPMLLSLAAAAAFLTASNAGRPRISPAAQILSEAPLSTLAAILKTSPQELAIRLKSRGYPVRSLDEPVGEIAAAAGVETDQLLFEVIPPKPSVSFEADEE